MLALDPRAIQVATPKRVRRSLPSWVATVPANEADKTTLYEGIRSQRVADAIRECRKSVMPERLAEAAKQAWREGLVTAKEYDELEREIV